MIANSYLHQLDPFAIQITETLGLRWYGLAYIAGFVVAWLIIRWMGKEKISPIQPERAGDFLFAGVFGVLVGGRLGYCFFYDPSLLYTFTENVPWWKLLAIQDGGMSSHGGMVGVLVAFVVWGKRNKISILHLLDVGSICATPGLFFGRVANFINGELWGKPIPEQMQLSPPAWSVKYPTEITEVWAFNPEFFVDKLNKLEPLHKTVVGGESFYANVVREAYAGNQEVVEVVKPLLTAWYPSQLFQASAEGPFLFITLFLLWWKPQKPGVIAGGFLLFYGITRVITEQYRQPDDGVSVVFGLSRGQLLSAIMIASGIAILIYLKTTKSCKIGGFSRAIIKNKQQQST